MNFTIPSSVKFIWCGITYAKDPKWMHETRYCDSYELFYVTDGVLHLSLDNVRYSVSPGEFLFAPPSHQAGFKESTCNFFWFHFVFLEEGLSLPLRYEKLSNFELFNTFCSLLAPYNYRGNKGGHLMSALLTEIDRSVSPEQNTTLLLSEKIKDYVRCFSPAELTCTSIATYFGYSPRYISSLFYKETGHHLKKYVTDEIMRRAKYFLTNSNLSIESIAQNLSYSDAHNFSHAFKAHEKISPGRYRKEMQKEKLSEPQIQIISK